MYYKTLIQLRITDILVSPTPNEAVWNPIIPINAELEKAECAGFWGVVITATGNKVLILFDDFLDKFYPCGTTLLGEALKSSWGFDLATIKYSKDCETFASMRTSNQNDLYFDVPTERWVAQIYNKKYRARSIQAAINEAAKHVGLSNTKPTSTVEVNNGYGTPRKEYL